MLRESGGLRRHGWSLFFVAVVGAAAALLVALGNPGNMGLCGACFLRDTAGALGFHTGKGPACFRPEIVGVLFGALGLALFRRRYAARSGSFAVTRFLLGVWMGIAALVFLGCPFRMLQRMGGGDLIAWAAFPGFVAGVGTGLWFERRGYSIGKTSVTFAPIGLLGPLAFAGVLLLFLSGVLLGPAPGTSGAPAHAPWLAAFVIALAAGGVLSHTGFCAVSAARQFFQRERAMLIAAACLVLGYAAVALATGKFRLAYDGPIAHPGWVWNVLALFLLGLTGALAGGCPVRQMVMAGEGNGDAFLTVMGIFTGGAVAQNLGLASSAGGAGGAGGATARGEIAVVIGLALVLVYAFTMRGTNKEARAQ